MGCQDYAVSKCRLAIHHEGDGQFYRCCIALGFALRRSESETIYSVGPLFSRNVDASRAAELTSTADKTMIVQLNHDVVVTVIAGMRDSRSGHRSFGRCPMFSNIPVFRICSDVTQQVWVHQSRVILPKLLRLGRLCHVRDPIPPQSDSVHLRTPQVWLQHFKTFQSLPKYGVLP